MFLSTLLLKLSGAAVNGRFWTLLCLFCNEVAIFMQFSAPMEAHMAQMNTEMCLWWWNVFVYNSIETSSPINRVLHIHFDTSDVPVQHLCITAPTYGGLYRTFYDILNTQFLLIFLVIRGQKLKMADRLWCKLSALSKHVKLMINYELVLKRPRFRLNPQPDPSTLYSFNPKVGILWSNKFVR